MKKKAIITISVVLAMCFMFCSAFAAGKMTVQNENFYAVDIFDPYAYVFARVENTGDKPVKYSAGLFEVYDENGDTLDSTDWVGCYPKILNPGETGFVSVNERVDDADDVSKLADYALTVTGKSADGTVVRFPAEGKYEENVQVNDYWTENYMTAEITNNTDETVYNVDLAMAILDDNDNILYFENSTLYSVGIKPGSSVMYRMSVSNTWKETWEKKGLTPSKIEAIAYMEKD